jgi:hypothetical protein
MKTIKISCPHCNQHIEAPREYSGKDLDCPACGKAFLAPPRSSRVFRTLLTAFGATFLLVIIVATVLIVLAQHEVSLTKKQFEADDRALHPEKFETSTQAVWRLEKEAEAVLLKGCSNYLGYSRTIDHYIDIEPDIKTNWAGNATIDFINKNGGMERTNLIFTFLVYNHHCVGYVDDGAMWDREMKEMQRLAGK